MSIDAQGTAGVLRRKARQLRPPGWLVRVLRYVGAIAISGLFIWLLLREVNLGELGPILREANPLYLVPIVALYLARFWIRALRWRALVSHLREIAPVAVLPRVILSQAANIVLPFQLGYGLMVQISAERFRIGRAQLFGAEAIERMSDGFVFAVFFLIALIALPIGAGFTALTAFLLFGTITGLSLAWWASRPRERPATEPPGVARFVWRMRSGFVEPFLQGMSVIHDRRATARVFALSFAVWSLEAMLYWMAGLALGLDVSPAVYFFLVAAANTGAGIPLVVSAIGFVLLGQQALIALETDPEVATAYILAIKGVVVVPFIVLGPLAAWLMRLSWREVFSLRRIEDAPGEPVLPGAGRR